MTDIAGAVDQLQLASKMMAYDGASWSDFAASVGEATHPKSTEQLMEYWAHGKGAAKINWAAPCAFCRCKRRLRKYFPRDPEGLCANLEKRATGHWPNAEHSRKKRCVPC